MKLYCFYLGVKHPLPQHGKIIAQKGQITNVPKYFHSVFPVGITLVSADASNDRLYLHLLDTPDSYFYELAFVQYPPTDRASFLLMLESIGSVSSLLCYHQKTVDIWGDINELFEYECNEISLAYLKSCQNLHREIYGRN